MIYDAIIIGGGVIGCGTARELSRYRLRVLLLEAASDICAGASRANTGIVHAGYDASEGSEKAKYNVLGNAMFDRLASELDVPFNRSGTLVVCFDEKDIPALEALRARGVGNGVPGLRVIGGEELHALEPNVSPRAAAALLAPTGGIVCPYGLTIAYAENAAENGVRFIREAPVTAVSRTREGLWRVESAGGAFEARTVVNAAGAHSDEICALAGAGKVTLEPRRGEYYIVDKKYAGTFARPVFQLPTALGKGVLIAPTVDGTILVGPNAEDISDRDDKRTTAAGLSDVLARGLLTWETIPKKGFITTFAGVRAHSAKDDFTIGELEDGFFAAVGIESPGLTSAPAIAARLAEDAAAKLLAEANADFNPIRRAIPRFAEMTDGERAAMIARDPDYSRVVCRCETVTEAEIRASIRRPVGATTLDGIKLRTRAGMGRCQAGFCLTRTMELLSEETGTPITKLTKSGGGSRLVAGRLFCGEEKE